MEDLKFTVRVQLEEEMEREKEWEEDRKESLGKQVAASGCSWKLQTERKKNRELEDNDVIISRLIFFIARSC